MFDKPRRIQNKQYLKWIRNIPCICCSIKAGYFPEGITSEAHHVPKPHQSIMGSKVSDYRTIPLCSVCHRTGTNSYHNIGRESFAILHNLDYEAIIDGLNKIYKELEEELANTSIRSNQDSS